MKILPRLIKVSKSLKTHVHPVRTFHVTFILKGSKVLAFGVNSAKTHPLTLKYKYHTQPNTHSELSALLKLGRDNCTDLTFVNIRLTKDNKPRLAKPCSGCIDMLHRVGFKKILYSVNGGQFYTIKRSSELHKRY